MISITHIEVGGLSSAGAFRGILEIPAGLHVVSADNAFGKTLACNAIGWCLALEPMFGIRDDDPVRFPLAVRENLDLEDGPPASIISSYASIGMLCDNSYLTLSRDIVGEPRHVAVSESEDGVNWRQSRMVARYHSMTDESGGLQNFLFRWCGLPRRKVLTNRGEPTDIYLENLAPHFIIDQTEGWSSVQALQVARYGQRDVAAASVEYLLGADDALKLRYYLQTAEARQERLKFIAVELGTQVTTAFARHGWPVDWSSYGKLDEVVARWTKKSLKEIARSRFNFDLAAEQQRLSAQLDDLRTRLTQEGLDPRSATAASDASQRVVDLKSQRHDVREQLRAIRTHKADQERVAESLEHRLRAAKDLVRLKQSGIGRLDTIECPTCHRDLDHLTFGLVSQDLANVQAHIDALQRDRQLVKLNIESCVDQMTRISAQLERIEAQLRAAERSLDIVNTTAGYVREQLAKIATDITATERELELNLAISAEFDRLQSEIDKWAKEVREVTGTSPDAGDFVRRRDAFLEALRRHLLALGHHGITAQEAPNIELDESYTPYVGGRRLRSLGSASDHARLVMAYALSLAEASKRVQGYHPGFIVLDEPLQQNPDKNHRELFVGFLKTLAGKQLPYNILIFTSLRPDEVAELRDAGVSVATPDSKHFLTRVPEGSIFA